MLSTDQIIPIDPADEDAPRKDRGCLPWRWIVLAFYVVGALACLWAYALN